MRRLHIRLTVNAIDLNSCGETRRKGWSITLIYKAMNHDFESDYSLLQRFQIIQIVPIQHTQIVSHRCFDNHVQCALGHHRVQVDLTGADHFANVSNQKVALLVEYRYIRLNDVQAEQWRQRSALQFPHVRYTNVKMINWWRIFICFSFLPGAHSSDCRSKNR